MSHIEEARRLIASMAVDWITTLKGITGAGAWPGFVEVYVLALSLRHVQEALVRLRELGELPPQLSQAGDEFESCYRRANLHQLRNALEHAEEWIRDWGNPDLADPRRRESARERWADGGTPRRFWGFTRGHHGSLSIRMFAEGYEITPSISAALALEAPLVELWELTVEED